MARGRDPITPRCWTVSPVGLGWARSGGGAALTGVILTRGGWAGSSSSERSTTSITVLLAGLLGTAGWDLAGWWRLTILVWGVMVTPVFLTAVTGDVGLFSLPEPDTGMATTPEGCLMGTPSLTSPLAGLATEFLAGLLAATLTTPLVREFLAGAGLVAIRDPAAFNFSCEFCRDEI